MYKWLAATILNVAERLPLEKLFIKPASNKKRIEELQAILGEAHTKPAEVPPEAPPAVPPAPPTEEPEDLKGFLEPRRQRVHLEQPDTGSISTEETVAYQNREVGKLLLRMERHYAQKLRINGVPCDCGSSKHLLDLESMCEETVPMVDNPDIYYRIVVWSKEVAPKSTDKAAKSGLYDDEYPVFARQARDFRKTVIGSVEASALFPGKAQEEVTELPLTQEVEEEMTEEALEKQRKDLLAQGFTT